MYLCSLILRGLRIVSSNVSGNVTLSKNRTDKQIHAFIEMKYKKMTNITMKRIYLFFTLLLIAMPSIANATPSVANDTTPMHDRVVATTLLEQNLFKDNVIAQMNYCTNALTNIVHNRSNAVLAYESDQLINNLSMEQACSIEEIKEYRTNLLNAISKFQITAEERQLLNRIQSIKKDNLKWQALSNALNPTMLVTGGGKMGIQLAFQATLAAARTAVEYKVASNELEIETLRAMWELRKQDMEEIQKCRTTSMKLILDLFQSHGLLEYDRLTEQTAQNLLKYISEPNAQKRVRLLKDNQKYYTKYAPYYYYLGMAYVDNNEYHKAKPFFQKYLNLYRANPIFRHDNMSGCIALTMLTYEKNLTREQIIELINTVRDNLPHNSAAHLQCALAYIYELNEEETGLEMLLSSIDDPFTSDREILYLAIANLAKTINNYPMLQSQIEDCMANESIIHLDNYLLYCINKQTNAWKDISQIIWFEDVATRKIESIFTVKNFNKDLSINIPKRFVMNDSTCRVVLADYIKNEFITESFLLYNDNYITLEEIEEVDCFKNNKQLKYLYVEEISKDKIYTLREGNVESIKNNTWHRQQEYRDNGQLSADDIKDIASFYKKYLPKNSDYTTWKFYDESSDYMVIPFDVVSASIGIGLAVSKKYLQDGKYLCLNFDNNIHIVYRYDIDKQDLIACFYQHGDKRVFASNEIEQELTENANLIAEVSYCDSTRGMWGAVKGWLKKDTTTNNTPQSVEAEPIKTEKNIKEKNDSTSSIFNTFKGWFKKDTTKNYYPQSVREEHIKVEENIKEENDTTSGIFNTIKSWFK